MKIEKTKLDEELEDLMEEEYAKEETKTILNLINIFMLSFINKKNGEFIWMGL